MPLFSSDPAHTKTANANGIHIAEPTAAPAQSRPRRQFNTLMQRVNVADERHDLLALLALLELQVEVAQIDQAGLDSLSDERIKQYNKILAGQLRDQERETAQLEDGPMRDLGLVSYRRLTPAQALRANVAQMQANVAAIGREVQALGDMTFLKGWLKTCQIPAPAMCQDGDWH